MNNDNTSSSSIRQEYHWDCPHMPLLSITTPSTIQLAASFLVQPTDVFIASYPKSGTTWIQHIVLSLLVRNKRNFDQKYSPNKIDEIFYEHVSEFAPFFDIDPHWEQQHDDDNITSGEPHMTKWIRDNQARLGRRVFNTHLRFNMLPNQGPCKIIYIVRSPLDTCVSFYHHLANQIEGGYNGSLNEFFDEWLAGQLPFGSWIDHVMSYATGFANGTTSNCINAKEEPNTAERRLFDNNCRKITLSDNRELLLVTYKDMVDDLMTVVQQIVSFLELENVTEEEIKDELIPTFSFQDMRNNLHRFQPKSVTWKNNFIFLRKGLQGDAQKTLTSNHQTLFQQQLDMRRMKETLETWFLGEKDEFFHTFMDLLQ